MELSEYKLETLSKIRELSDVLAELSDDELADLYHVYSEQTYRAGWVFYKGNLDSFIEWATTPPYKLRKSR